MASGGKRFLQWTITILFSILVILIGGEVILRIYDSAKGVTAPYTHNLSETLALPNGYFNYDLEPNLKITYDSKNPRKFSINRWGFRSPDYNPIKPKETLRIFCLGGSSTFDPYVSDEETWSSLVGKKLNSETKRKIECINAGRYGYATSEIIGLFYHRVLRHQPDMIIIYSTYNDATRKYSPYYGADDSPQLYGNTRLSFWNKHSALFAAADFHMRHLWNWKYYSKLMPNNSYSKEPPPEHVEFLQDEVKTILYNADLYERNIRTIINIAKNNHIKVLLSTQISDTDKQTELVLSLYNSKLRKIAREEKVILLDLASYKVEDIRKDSILESYVHLTKKGCEFLSDKMVKKIMGDTLLNPSHQTLR